MLAHLFQETEDGAGFKAHWVMEECHNNMMGIRQSAGSRAQAPAGVSNHQLVPLGAVSAFPYFSSCYFFCSCLEIILDLQKVAKIGEFPYILRLASNINILQNHGIIIIIRKLIVLQTNLFVGLDIQIWPVVPLMFFFWSRI